MPNTPPGDTTNNTHTTRSPPPQALSADARVNARKPMLQGSAKDIRKVCHYIRAEGEGSPRASENATRLQHTLVHQSFLSPKNTMGVRCGSATTARTMADNIKKILRCGTSSYSETSR
ncbi:hypothetical protein HPB50_023401 [Hyalomma asiaticum]|uniref:Uncharacterized protein n=1 Tax=Hyalomma asiaticum TaxID=266040 RepID=A0ACB7S607_HYAAI|nr:hypothetical protein HPB50_023401 [Hyalomma asiaticum]